MNSRRVTCLLAGVMSFPPNRNGNMPVGQGRPPPIPGVLQLPAQMRIIVPADIRRPAMWGCMLRIHGAFLICMAMSGSGPRIGTRRRIPRATRRLIPLDQHRARLRVTRGGSWSGGGTVLRSAERSSNPPGNRYIGIGFRVAFQQQ